MTPKISIVIPTIDYLRQKEKIYQIIAAIENQKTKLIFEVIIVDNAPNISKETTDTLPSFVRIIREPKQGLSRARNTGILVSKGDIIAFIDDDVIPAPTWIDATMQAYKIPDTLCVGGPVILEDSDSVRYPIWFSDYFLRFIIPPKFPESTGIIKAPYYIIGANMSFKRNIFNRYGFFDVELGRIGNCLLSGEDMEFMMRLPQNGIFYEPLAITSTKITQHRLTRIYFVQRIFWQAVSDARILRKHNLNQYYDRSELFFSIDFIKRISTALRQGLIFQLFCITIRIITFKIVSFFNL